MSTDTRSTSAATTLVATTESPMASGQSDDLKSGTVVESPRVPALDGLRGFAILSVVLFHYINNQLPGATNKLVVLLREVTSFGWAGVDLFFVLSGFLLTDVAIKRCRSKNFLFVFTMRRILRVLPVYLLFLLAYAVLTQIPPLANSSFLSGEQVIPFRWYFTLLHNNYMAAIGQMGNPSLSVTWSLAVEEQFYIVLPVIAVLVRARRLAIVLAIGALAAIAFRSIHSDWVYRYVLLPCRLDSIAIGGLAACLASGVVIPFDPKQVARYAMLIIAGGFVLVAIVWGIFHDLGVLKHTILATICSAVLLVVAFTPQHPLTRLFSQSWLRYLGVISYSLYLIHYFLLGCFHAVLSGQEYIGITNARDIWVSLAALLCSILLAMASRTYFEKPFIDYGRRFSYR